MFSGDADFSSSTFSGDADFSDGAFGAETHFEGARFETRVPRFYQRTMHQNTTFATRQKDVALWPAISKDNATASKDAYTRLRVIMNDLQKPDDEHFFFRQEMRCKQLDEGPPDSWVIWAYGVASGYGFSVVRPLLGLLLTIFWGWVFIGSYLKNALGVPGSKGIFAGLGVSFDNTFAFLGFAEKMHPGFYDDTPFWLNALAGTQTVLGVILLFFLGLGLRNRFRLK